MHALIGQCRGDLELFVRQLGAVHVAAARTPKGFTLTFRSPVPSFVVLGDIVGPLNAWGTCSPLVASDDAAILQLAVQVSDATGMGVVPGLNELMLLGDDTSRCQLGKTHRKLLALARSPPFREAWRRATRRAPEAVCRAARTVAAIVHDNAARPPPAPLAPYWPRLSALDRGTRFVVRGPASSLIDAPQVGLASRAFAPVASAVAEHLAFEYNRLRCGAAEWGRAAEPIARAYADFDALRRRCIATRSSGAAVADHVSHVLDRAVLREELERRLAVIVSRYAPPATAAELASAALAAFAAFAA
jgi:hypothetical protein